MKNIFIINGHERYPFTEGRLNMTLITVMQEELARFYSVKTSVLQDGWNVKEEQEKFIWADAVIFQMPIYWFAAPALLKKYMEEVYEYGLFYKGSSDYGRGGLLTDKKYMLSSTWNSPKDIFSDETAFFDGRSVDDVLIAMHKTHQFLGMTPLPGFSCHDVVKNPDIQAFADSLKAHLKQVFNL